MPKRYLLFTLICLVSWQSKAQVPKAYYLRPNDVVMVGTDYGVPSETRSLADSYRIITPDTANQGRFIIKDYYLDGKIKLIGSSKSGSPYANFDGSCIGFFNNGKRKFIESYKNGTLYGDVIKYYPNGKLYVTGSYDDQQKFLLTVCHDTSGVTIAADGKGRWIKYDEYFKLVKGDGAVVNGVEEDDWTGNVNDTVTYKCTYKNGKIVSGVSRERSGTEHKFGDGFESAEFNGGLNAFGKYLAGNIRYPATAHEHNVQGKVFITFVVEVDGTLSNLMVLRGIGSGCDDEASRVIGSSSGNWKPALYLGVPARMQYTVPIGFTLGESNSK